MNERGRDEHELVRRCREGSEAAYAELVRHHRPRLYTIAYRLLGEREVAEDVVQETFLAAFRQIERVEPRPSLDPWLNTIVIRIAGRAARRLRARPTTQLDPLGNGEGAPGLDPGLLVRLDASGDPHAALEAAELGRDLMGAIAGLPFKYRAAVVLRHVMGLDYAEAAASLGVPLNTFKSHLLRATRLLRADLAGTLDETTPRSPSHFASALDEATPGSPAGNGRQPTDAPRSRDRVVVERQTRG